VPSQTRARFAGSRISAANRPHGRFRTPLYRGGAAVAVSHAITLLVPISYAT
jgi:hypothetical protein